MNEPFNDMNDAEFEEKLGRLSLAMHSDDYVPRGMKLAGARAPLPFWHRLLPMALSTALVISVSANVYQLVHNRQQIQALENEQLVQCNTPVAASPVEHAPDYGIAVPGHGPKPLGMC